jgi:hypothetical protein
LQAESRARDDGEGPIGILIALPRGLDRSRRNLHATLQRLSVRLGDLGFVYVSLDAVDDRRDDLLGLELHQRPLLFDEHHDRGFVRELVTDDLGPDAHSMYAGNPE